MRVAIYARVSTRDKDQNPETQLLPLRQYARTREWEVFREYIDLASSADLKRRTQWREMLDQVRIGGFDVVLVVKLDRAFRSSKHTHDTLEYLGRHKVDFVASTQPIDTTTSTGKLTLSILAAVAEFERELIRERTIDGMDRAEKEGKHIGRPKGSKDKRKRQVAGYYQRWAH